MERGAMAVSRVLRPGLFESDNCTRSIAEFFTGLGQSEPNRRIGRNQLDNLHQQIRCTFKIAFGLAIARPLEASVGNQVAGGDECGGGQTASLFDGLGTTYLSGRMARRHSNAAVKLEAAEVISNDRDRAKLPPQRSW